MIIDSYLDSANRLAARQSEDFELLGHFLMCRQPLTDAEFPKKLEQLVQRFSGIGVDVNGTIIKPQISVVYENLSEDDEDDSFDTIAPFLHAEVTLTWPAGFSPDKDTVKSLEDVASEVPMPSVALRKNERGTTQVCEFLYSVVQRVGVKEFSNQALFSSDREILVANRNAAPRSKIKSYAELSRK